MNKVFALAGAIALSIIPTPTFSGEVEQQEMSSVTKLLLPQIGEKFKNLDIKEKKEYKEALINYLEDVQKTGATGVSEAFDVGEGWCAWCGGLDRDVNNCHWMGTGGRVWCKTAL